MLTHADIRYIERRADGDSVLFDVHIDGQVAELTAGQLCAYDSFRRAVLEQTGLLFVDRECEEMSRADAAISWAILVNALMETTPCPQT